MKRYPNRAVFAFVLLLLISSSVFAMNGNSGNSVYPGTSFHEITEWEIKLSVKNEALCFLNALLGDPYYLNYYQRDYNYFSKLFTPEVERALKNLYMVRRVSGMILSASLTYLFSVDDDESLGGLLKAMDDSASIFEKHRETGVTINWVQQVLYNFTVKRNLKTVIEFLIANDFEGYWKDRFLATLNHKSATLTEYLKDKDIIPVIEKRLGFPLSNGKITLYLLYFNEPHGISLVGTKFITGQAYPADLILRNAIHEMMQPPLDFKDLEFRAVLRKWNTGDFPIKQVREHYPEYGYNTYNSFVEENLVDALEIFVAQEIGMGIDTETYFSTHDGGMDVLAMAIFAAMKAENFATADESYLEFLVRISRTRLTPGKIEEGYREFLGK